MKISVLLPDLRGGGAERVNLDLAREFVWAGHQVEFVLCRAQGEFLDEVRNAFSVVDLNAARVRQLPRALFKYLRERSPDVLLASMWPLTFIAPLIVRAASPQTRVLVSEHGILSAQYRDWGVAHRIALKATTSLGYRLADRRVGVSNGVTQDMARLAAMSADRFATIYNPVAPRSAPSMAEIAAAEALWAAPPGKRIITVGTMKAVKNYPLLLRAFARLQDATARLMFVGDGVGREALALLAQELGVANRVVFAGFCSDPTPFYQTADLFVLSSNYEGFGNVIVEALACGTPVVSTDCPSGPAEILSDGLHGKLVPVGDKSALARAIMAALEEASNPEALRQRAADFLPSIAAKQYLDLMEIN